MILNLLKTLTKHLNNLILTLAMRSNGKELIVPIGYPQKGTISIVVNYSELFKKRNLFKKIVSIVFGLKLKQEQIEKIALSYAKDECFGGPADFGNYLLALNKNIQNYKWDLNTLTEMDLVKAEALESLSVMTRNYFVDITAEPSLSFSLADSDFELCLTIIPMSSCILIRSIRYYIEINAFYSFSSIRKSSHPRKEELIAFIYELMSLQQKTAIELCEFQESCAISSTKRDLNNNIQFLYEEMNAIRQGDLITSYLKATIEKTISLVGEIHEISGIENLKKHSSRVKCLQEKLSEKYKNTQYGKILMNYIQSENLSTLNNLRTGVLHKKGSSLLQPHSYFVQKKTSELPLGDLLQLFKYHHGMNSIILIGTLAMITDNIIDRKSNSGEDLQPLKDSLIQLTKDIFDEIQEEK